MKCPRDQTEFEQTLVDGHQVYRCPDCKGIYLPGNTIDPLLGSGELLKLRSLCSAKPSALVCPFDGKILGEAKIAAVTIDLCLECNALWLDWGELQLLQKRRKMTDPQGVTRDELIKAGRGAGASGAGEAILLGFLTLLS